MELRSEQSESRGMGEAYRSMRGCLDREAPPRGSRHHLVFKVAPGSDAEARVI
ncbi:hypothetical protein NSZ01_31210 [Nocardioides szechwanensis]|nr:hypothetical protein NSZ01_31210 [Nocardioides szechwanensis]